MAKTKARKRLVTSAVLGAALLVAAQFVPVERSNPPVEMTVTAPAPVQTLLVRACFDCHSHESRWPWYSHVAPVSWLIAKHVREGRKDLNFSRWPAFDFVAQDLILREISQQVAAGAMPPRSYRLGHPEARLSKAEIQILLDWAGEGSGDEGGIW